MGNFCSVKDTPTKPIVKQINKEIHTEDITEHSLLLNSNHIYPWNSTSDNSCEICFETYHTNDKMYLLPCMHYFHYECILQWTNTCNKKGNVPLCPLCDQEIK